MENNNNTCIVNWDLYHKQKDTKTEFVAEIKSLHLKKDNNEKSKEKKIRRTRTIGMLSHNRFIDHSR